MRGLRYWLNRSHAAEQEFAGIGQARVEEAGSGLTRRQLLMGTGAFVGLGALQSSGANEEAAKDLAQWTAGVIERIEPGMLHIRGPGGAESSEQAIKLSDDATTWRDAPGVALTAFAPGEEVHAEGRWEGGAFVATHVSAVWEEVVGRVLGKTEGTLETTGGTIRLTPGLLLWDGYGLATEAGAGPEVGEDVWAIGRYDRPTQTLVAQKIGPKKAGQ